nr:hypothetical protein GCM10020063_076770 [Dactylosporangium thailandense]
MARSSPARTVALDIAPRARTAPGACTTLTRAVRATQSARAMSGAVARERSTADGRVRF